MKKTISMILVVLMLFSVINVSVVAANIATPKATASNDVGGVKIYWNKVDGAVKYNVYRREGGSSSWVLAGTTTATLIIDKGVSNGKYYAYSVRAYDVNNSYSAYNAAMTYSVKCVATPKLTSLTNDTNGLKLTWGAVSGASYRVYRRGAGTSTWTYLGTTNSTTFTDTKASSGKYWRYTVRAISNGYYSGFDTNGLFTMRLANPYSIKAIQCHAGVKVTWSKINGAIGYRVYRRGAGQSSWKFIGATSDCQFVDRDIPYGENYYRYTVRATRGNIYSGFYTEGSVVKVIKISCIYSGQVGLVNGKLYAVKCVGKHVANDCKCGEDLRDNNSKNVIPVLPTSLKKDTEEFTSFCYYNGYVYYAVQEYVFFPDFYFVNRVYRCTPDWKSKQLLAETVYDDNHNYDTDVFVTQDFFIYGDYIYFNNFGYHRSLVTGTFSVGYEIGVPQYNFDVVTPYCYDTKEFLYKSYNRSITLSDCNDNSNTITLVTASDDEFIGFSGGYVNGWLYYSKGIRAEVIQLRKVNVYTKQDVLVSEMKTDGRDYFFQ